jgi:PAS domain S-box-containing protein
LLVEDDEDDYILTRELLSETRGSRYHLEWATSFEDGLKALAAGTFDAVLVDYNLGPENGLDLMRAGVELGFPGPYILLTGQGSYDVDLAAMQAGAADYIVKGEIDPGLLERAIRYAIERQRLLKENRQQQELLRTIFEVDPGGLAVVTLADGVIQYANPAFAALAAGSSSDLVGKPVETAWPPLEGFAGRQALAGALAGGATARLDRQLGVCPDGSRRYFSVNLRKLDWNDHPAVLVALWETTALEEARQHALRAAEEAHQRAAEAEEGKRILDALMEYIPEGITIADAPDMRTRRVSRYGQILSGIPRGVVEGAPGGQLDQHWSICQGDGQTPVTPEEFPLARAVLYGEVVTNQELLITRPEGDCIPILCNAGPIRDPDGQITGGVIAWRDITERKQAEEDMRRKAGQIEAQHYLTQFREQERLQIARDLHDGPIQELIGICFTLQEVMDDLPTAEERKRIDAIQTRVQGQVRDLRTFCNELRPPALAPFGLEKVIRSHVEKLQFDHPQLDYQLDLEADGQTLPEPIRLALFRICQELLNNVIRHAQASRVVVRLHTAGRLAELTVSDDGIGFETPDEWVALARQGHLGLVGVLERAEAVGGATIVHSVLGQGTEVRVQVELPEKSEDRAA